ncbi:amidohydrolase family protein [Streptomyces sp. NPDC006333]|uniref:amidohydrolase family protein n=1 Tax=Streptomyces sp. NPDC006333 TaxID=3156753 RepID=UPI0033B0CE32
MPQPATSAHARLTPHRTVRHVNTAKWGTSRTSTPTTTAADLERSPHLVGYLRGRRKVLFGSNYPMITPSQALEHLSEPGLDEETTELFLSGNARRVFRLGDHS